MAITFSGVGVAAARRKFFRCEPPAHQADNCCREHDGRKWHMEEINCNEGGSADAPERCISKRTRSNAPSCEEYDRGDRRFDAIQQARDQRRAFPDYVNPR